jgi:hypothetical protein
MKDYTARITHRGLPDLSAPTMRLALACAAVFWVFLLYAPAVRLMPLHDDAVIILNAIVTRAIDIFINPPAGLANYRPVAILPWLLTRDFFGWFIPPILHVLNVWSHVLNVALVFALVKRLPKSLNHNHWLPLLCALIVGLFPLSFQAVLWAGALPHPLMATFGLLGVHAYLEARKGRHWIIWLLAALLLICACLTHESGFQFGVYVLLLEAASSLAKRRAPHLAALGLTAITLAYPILYRLFLHTSWSSGAAIAINLPSVLSNLVYFLQGMVTWLLILLRTKIDLGGTAELTIVVLFFSSIAIALLCLWRAKMLAIGLGALLCWAVAIAPSVLFVDPVYVRLSPRLMYVPSIAIALFWGAFSVAVLKFLRAWPLRATLLTIIAFMMGWCVVYISDHTNETARLTPALLLINNDLQRSKPADTFLFVNMPEWNMPAYPSFLIGAEGMPIFQRADTPAWSWFAAIANNRRDVSYVRHDISLTHDPRYVYGIAGPIVNDVVLRERLLKADYSYRFDYDPPGLRIRRLAHIGMDKTVSAPLAKLEDGDIAVAIRSAAAAQCGNRIVLNLTWSDAHNMSQPVGVFVHVLDDHDQQALVADHDVIDGYLPLEQVPPGIVITETRVITIPATVGTLKQVALGAYLRVNGKRLSAIKADGGQWTDNTVSVPIDGDLSNLCQDISQ